MREFLGFIRRLLREQPYRFVFVVTLLGASGLAEGVGIASIVPLIDIMGGSDSSVTPSRFASFIKAILDFLHMPFTLGAVLGLFLAFLMMQQFLILAQNRLMTASAYKFEADLRTGLFDALLGSDWSFMLRQKSGEMLSAMTAEPMRAGYAYKSLANLLGSMLVAIVYAGLALALSWQMTAIVLFAGAMIMFLLRGRLKAAHNYGFRTSELNADVQGHVQESLSAAKLLKGCSIEEESQEAFHALAHVLAHNQFLGVMNQFVSKFIYEVSALAIIVGVIFLAVTRFELAPAEILVFLFVFYRLSPRLSQAQKALQSVMTLFPGLSVIDSMKVAAVASAERAGGEPFRALESGINFSQIDYAYHDGHPVLRGVTLDIERGRTTAIVGPSGSGKTTVVDLLMGLLSPDHGMISVDGVSLAEIDLHEWRTRIGYVAQDASFFHASVRDNIRLTKPDATDDQVSEAARFAYAEEFIENLPEGYDTIIGDRGVALSGGQRQRLALARAILRNPDLLVLDEATSALDAESEHKIQSAIEELSRRMTVIVITHSLSTVRLADRIYFLESGQVVEHGTWNELLSRHGRFDTMHAIQERDR